MNRMGALMNILLAIGIGFIIWKALDERLDVVEKLVSRIRPLRKHPRISLAVMLAVLLNASRYGSTTLSRMAIDYGSLLYFPGNSLEICDQHPHRVWYCECWVHQPETKQAVCNMQSDRQHIKRDK